ncbi:MAG: hypothetical protein ACSLEL_01930 [Candidatus Malihini olakiniferum]
MHKTPGVIRITKVTKHFFKGLNAGIGMAANSFQKELFCWL